MATTFNLEHSEVGPSTAEMVDVPGTVTLETSISSTANYVSADASKYAVAWTAPEGSGSLVFVESDFGVLSVINGGETSTSGSGDTEILRYEQPDVAVNPDFIISGFARNMSKRTRADWPAFRVTVPQASASPAASSLGQETWGEWSTPIGFVGDDDGQLIIYEQLASVPELTSDIMGTSINVTRPA